MKKIKSWIVPVLVIIVLLIPIVVKMIEGNSLKIKTYSEFYSELSNSDNTIVYFGYPSSENYESKEETLRNIKNEYDSTIYTIDVSKLTGEQIDELVEFDDLFEEGEVYVLIYGGEIRKVVPGSISQGELSVLVNKYINNIIDADEIAYKTISSYKEFKQLVESKQAVIHVFGRNSCSWCNRFKPIYNEVANETKLNVYYYDSDSFNSTEYSKILKSDIKIPASCSSSGVEQSLSEGFGTPLTLFTKNGKVVGCISGYRNKTNLLEELKSAGILK